MRRVAVVAPANTMNYMDPNLVEVGRRALERLGFEVRFGAHVRATGVFGVAPIAQRLEDFAWAMSDPEIDIVMPAYGGYNSNQLLQHLDYECARHTGKTYIGYSDVSALLLALGKLAGCRVFHGPAFVNFCDPGLLPYTIDGFLQILNGSAVTYRAPEEEASDEWHSKPGWGPRDLRVGRKWRVYREGTSAGPLVGGNLETLCSLAGTRYFPSLSGALLFVEDTTGASPAGLQRSLTQLQQMGCFAELAGMMVGSFPTGSTLAQDEILWAILDDVLAGTSFPVVCGVACSHVTPMMTLPLYRHAELYAQTQTRLVVANA